MQPKHVLTARGGMRIDASQPDTRAVLHRIADRIATSDSPDWVLWERIAEAIAAGEAVQQDRQRKLLVVDDDPGLRGTHSRAEWIDAEYRKISRIRSPWMRQSAKGDKAHVERKRRHSDATIAKRAVYRATIAKYAV